MLIMVCFRNTAVRYLVLLLEAVSDPVADTLSEDVAETEATDVEVTDAVCEIVPVDVLDRECVTLGVDEKVGVPDRVPVTDTLGVEVIDFDLVTLTVAVREAVMLTDVVIDLVTDWLGVGVTGLENARFLEPTSSFHELPPSVYQKFCSVNPHDSGQLPLRHCKSLGVAGRPANSNTWTETASHQGNTSKLLKSFYF
jgi:hypothetical protein